MQKNIKERVYTIISRLLDVPIDQINEDSSPDSIEVWDSLQHMNLVLALEEEFSIEFSDQQITEMLSVGLIIAIVNEINK